MTDDDAQTADANAAETPAEEKEAAADSPQESQAPLCPALAVLTVAEMGRADALTIEGGEPGRALMARAGRAVAEAIFQRWPRRRAIVLCGAGNNGGDGYVCAGLLMELGWQVEVYSVTEDQTPLSDAEWAREFWGGESKPIDEETQLDLTASPLIIDALFGAGLSRPVEGPAAAVLAAVAASDCPVVAVDVPSGLDGDTGILRGTVAPASMTVTFFRPKPGHLLLPGKAVCGDLKVAQIGIADEVLTEIAPQAAQNGPALWRHGLSAPSADMHKFSRGAALVYGGGTMAGAARLVAGAARRSGAGYVAAAVPLRARPIYAADAPGLVLIDRDSWGEALNGGRYSAFCIGPGAGIGEEIASATLTALATGYPGVIDADALMSFEQDPYGLFRSLGTRHVLTPHESEFARLFSDVQGNKLFRARAAAERSGAIIILKGADTVIAAPDGRAAINSNAPSSLATAGSGDVLAGILVGLLSVLGASRGAEAEEDAPEADGFEMACAAVWLHGETAQRGPGHATIAEDLIDRLPEIVTSF